VIFAHSDALLLAGDLDTDADGIDDTLSLRFVSLTEQPAGLFARVTFDCIAPQPATVTADSFSCIVQSASTADGGDLGNEHCTLEVR
jgi:hypothetical protein